MDLKYALGDEFGGDELEETAPYTQWPRLLRQILGASVLVSVLVFFVWEGKVKSWRGFCTHCAVRILVGVIPSLLSFSRGLRSWSFCFDFYVLFVC